MSIFKKGTAQVITAPIPTPPARHASLTVTPPDALCVLVPRGDREIPPITATGSGHQTFTLGPEMPQWGADLTVTAPGYDPFTAWVVMPASDMEWPAVELVKTVVQLPPLVRQGQFYYQQDGTPFTVKEASAFRLYERFLNGEDIGPVLAQWQVEGFNLLRVWLLNTSVGHILPWEHADFYDRIPELLQACARFGLYVELTVFTQTQTLLPTLAAQQAHYDRTVTALGSTFCFVEGANEYDQHDNAFDPRLRLWKPAGATFDLCRASGGADSWAIEPVLESARFHTNDLGEWQRKVKTGLEIADAFHVPCIVNENTRPDNDGTLARHQDAAACAALLTAGYCFHSESGKHARVMEGLDLEAARAVIRGIRSVDLSQRTGGYVHGEAEKAREKAEGLLRVFRKGAAVVTIRP